MKMLEIRGWKGCDIQQEIVLPPLKSHWFEANAKRITGTTSDFSI